MRRWISTMTLIGAIDRVQADEQSRFLIKGGVSMELRLGLGARSTQDVDIVFRGPVTELLDALQEAFEHPYAASSSAARASHRTSAIPAPSASLSR